MGTLTKVLAAPVLFLTLTAGMCSTTGDLCDGARPIRLDASEIDLLTDETQIQITAHNKMLEEQCGARPPLKETP